MKMREKQGGISATVQKGKFYHAERARPRPHDGPFPTIHGVDATVGPARVKQASYTPNPMPGGIGNDARRDTMTARDERPSGSK